MQDEQGLPITDGISSWTAQILRSRSPLTRNLTQPQETHVDDHMRFVQIRHAQRVAKRLMWVRMTTPPSRPACDGVPKIKLPNGRQPHVERSWGHVSVRMWNPRVHRPGFLAGRLF